MIFTKGFNPPKQWRTFRTRYIGRVQGKSGELPRQFTARFAETPLQALHNFAVGIAVARITRVIAACGLDPCFGFLHDGRKPGRFSLAWDAIEVFRPALATAVFDYAETQKFERADFASQDGVVRLSPWIARECLN
jgi:CRISPR/Cas system-associated endonuclease Cas1